jgi:hypothetical protein
MQAWPSAIVAAFILAAGCSNAQQLGIPVYRAPGASRSPLAPVFEGSSTETTDPGARQIAIEPLGALAVETMPAVLVAAQEGATGDSKSPAVIL